jgi:phosphohistidine phosphatase
MRRAAAALIRPDARLARVMRKKPVKELILLRHAKSSWKNPLLHDIDRPLNRRGQRTALLMADWFSAVRCRPDVVLCSSAARTRETLDFLRESLGRPVILHERELYLASAKRLLERLRKLPATTRSVLLIGHNPGLRKLALQLIADRSPEERTRIQVKFPTAAAARFEVNTQDWRGLGPDTARLLAFVSPRDLRT